MSKLDKKVLTASILNDNTEEFLTVSDCLELIEDSEFKDDLLSLFSVDKILNEEIQIKGLSQVMKSVIKIDELFEKIDIESTPSNISCHPKNKTIKLTFHQVEELGLNNLEAEAIYSAKRDYFDGEYEIRKFADFCIENDSFDIIIDSIERLNQKLSSAKSRKKYRLLKDKDEKYYVRAITSVDRYRDYNIKFSLFVTAIAIHELAKETNEDFNITYCEYSESFIKIYISKKNFINLEDIGYVNLVLEMTNNEIKRGALKFNAVFNIQSVDKDGVLQNVHLKKGKKLRTPLISMGHGSNAETVVSRLGDLSDFITQAENEMKEDIKKVTSIENPDQIKFLLQEKIKNIKTKPIKKYKEEIDNLLKVRVSKISDLLVLMGKIDTHVGDLDAKEHLRYIFYDILMDRQ